MGWMESFNADSGPAIAEKVTPLYLRRNPVLRLLERMGCIKWNASGTSFTQEYEDGAEDINFGTFGAFEELDITPGGDRINMNWLWSTLMAADAVSGMLLERVGGQSGSYRSGVVRKHREEKLNKLIEKFEHRLPREILLGDYSSVNGGGERTFLGLLEAYGTSNSTGTIGGLARANYENIRHPVVDCAAGPSTNARTDAFERFLTAQEEATVSMKAGDSSAPNLVLGTKAGWTALRSKALDQKTDQGVDMKTIKMIDGVEYHVDENMTSQSRLHINANTLELCLPGSGDKKKRLFSLRAQKNLPSQVHPDDEFFVITLQGCFKHKFPRGNTRCVNDVA